MYKGWEGCQETEEADAAREGGGRMEKVLVDIHHPM